IALGVFTSVADVGKKLRKYIRAYSKSARPFRWTYTDLKRRITPNKIAGTAYSVCRILGCLYFRRDPFRLVGQLPELFVDGRSRKGRNEDADKSAALPTHWGISSIHNPIPVAHRKPKNLAQLSL